MNESILRVGTFNIRFDGGKTGSSIVTQGELSWHVRRVKVADTILFHRMDLIGIQEALYNQITDLDSLLGSDWNWIGVGRDDGKKSGEFVPIFYNKNRLKLLDSKHFWLSERPDVPGSIGWDAHLTRVATQATFQDLLTNSTFIWINTHFDHGGAKARLESSELLLNHTRELLQSRSSAVKVFLSGDFNCEENEEPYKLLTRRKYQDNNSKDRKDFPTIGFTDTRYEISGLKGGSFGFSNTFTGFSRNISEERIDFIFVENNSISTQAVKVISHGVVSNLYDDGMYISDHRLVISDLLIH
ncbi:Endonuclease/exonuclease/phosphatase [Glomus cerebriforme]|uniref:Endonuclease/exonuclease/phosphatase n=1 Tax=Glomus cerebriforme TaxID=658196 RepID=A0A397TKD1_9GLOM|nr:Endonuclease/exonuclease/phosphatase [Glomus cerebriforme]